MDCDGKTGSLICEQSLRILALEGYKALSIGNIVKRCGISKTTFYKHFASKTDLLEKIRTLAEPETDVMTQREDILLKASQAFFQLGVDEISMEAIARASGITRSSLYRYFSSKEEILEYAIQYELKSRKQLLSTLKEQIRDPLEQLLRLIEISCEPAHQHYDTLMLVTSRYKLYKNKLIREYFNELVEYTTQMVAEILENGRNTGIFRKDLNPVLMSSIFLAAFNGIDFNYPQDTNHDASQIKREAFQVFINLIQPQENA
jgi:AcrR family transcriptional regulator